MKVRLILTLLLGLFVFGCSQNSTGSNQEGAGLTLNHGKKWKVNDDMMVHIHTAENAVKTFETSGEKDYDGLAEELKTNIDRLTSSCTMKGKAHDELHKWLHPYINLVADLEEQETAAEEQKSFDKIQDSFQEFNQYFK